MSTWLDKFKEDLAKVVASGNTTKAKSAFDIAGLVSASTAMSPLAQQRDASKALWDSYNPAQKLLYADGTQKILDILARPNYASASMQGELEKQRQDEDGQNWFSKYVTGGITDLPKALGAAVEGLEGQSKKTYHDVLDLKYPSDPDNSAANWSKGIGGFVLDVGLDPTTYIGPGAVKAAGKAVGLGKVAEKLPEAVKNEAILDLAEKGTATTTEKVANDLAQASTKVAPDAEKIKSTLDEVNPEDAVKAMSSDPVEAPLAAATASPEAAKLAMLLARRDALDSSLRGVQTLKYPGLDPTALGGYVTKKTIKRPTLKQEGENFSADIIDDIEHSKLTGDNLAIWETNAGKLINDPEDLKYLKEAETTDDFDKRLTTLMGKASGQDYADLNALDKAMKSGAVTHPAGVFKAHSATSMKGARRVRTKLDEQIRLLETPTAEEQVAKTAAGDTEALAQKQVPLLPHEAEAVSQAVAKTLKDDFFDPMQFKYESKSGALREGPGLRDGSRTVYLGLNAPSQYTLHKNLFHEFSKTVPEGITGDALAAYKYDHYLPLLKASEDTLIARGINPISGYKATGLPLSLHDVLRAMPREFVERHMFNKLSGGSYKAMQIPPSNWLDAGTLVVEASRKGLDLTTPEVRSAIARALMKNTSGANSWQAMNKAASDAGGKAVKFANSRINRAIDKFIKNAPELVKAVNDNSARIGIKYGEYVEKLRKEAIEPLMGEVMAEIGNGNRILSIVNGVNKYVANAAKDIGYAPDGAIKQVADEATADLAATLPVARIKEAAAVEKAVLRGDDKATIKLLESSTEEVPEIIGKTANMAETLEYGWGVRFARAMFPHIGNADIRPLLLEKELAASTFSAMHAKMLNKIDKEFTRDEIVQAFTELQRFKDTHPNPRIQQAMDTLKPAISMVYNTDGTGIISRNGIRLEDINRKFAAKGIPSRFKFDTDLDYNFGLASWTKWTDVEDPLNLLSRTYAAVQSAVADRMLADSLILKFGSKAKTAERTTRMINTDRTSIAKLIGEDVYFAPDIAKQMRVLEATIKELNKAPSRSKLFKLYDSVLHSYKLGLTSYNVQHHFRNMYGDMWLAFMDGLQNPKYYTKSRKVLQTRKGNYRDYDFDIFNIGELGKDSKNIITVRHNGKDIPLSADNLYRLAAQKAVLPNWHIIEDLGVGASDEILQTSASDFLKRISPFKGKIHNAVTDVSEYREHFARMAHFLYAMDQVKLNPKLKFEEALDLAASEAGARVRKWHPDGSDYSQFEKQTMRRLILFYSWIRKAIPLVIESAVTRPGRFMIFPKTMYNLAGANGIDLHGYGDPFPVDQLFPTWMHDYALGPQMGKSGHYFGMRMGMPGTDVLEQYFSSPLTTWRTLVSGTTPAFKVAAEVASQHSLRTGADISTDWPSYVMNQLPFAARANAVVGDPVGNDAPTNKGYEPQLDTPVGTLDSRGISALNWLTGLGITDMSKPSYQRSAQLEKRDKGGAK